MTSNRLRSIALATSTALTLGAAHAQQEFIQLSAPRTSLTLAEGTVRFPFSYRAIAPESGRKMYDSPVVKGYYDKLVDLARGQGYSRACLSRQIYHLAGTDRTLASSEASWVSALQGAPTRYTLVSTVPLAAFSVQGDTVQGKVYQFKVPGVNVLNTFAFFRYDNADITWVLECGSGR